MIMEKKSESKGKEKRENIYIVNQEIRITVENHSQSREEKKKLEEYLS
jgi:hypothetical protein